MARTGARAAIESALPGGGWPWLAASLLLTAGAYNTAWGAMAIAGDNPFAPEDLLLSDLDTQVWGALTLIWGLALLASAALLYAGRLAGVKLGTVIAATALVIEALALKEAPGWAIVAMAICLALLFVLSKARQTIERSAAEPA
jgi:uncharacterized membrane protein